jgi:hypothetical protein
MDTSYSLSDGYFLGYQNNLTLSMIRKLKHTITGHHRVTVAKRGLMHSYEIFESCQQMHLFCQLQAKSAFIL